jgi:hypothetical protein
MDPPGDAARVPADGEWALKPLTVLNMARLDPGRVEVLAGPMALVWVPTELPLVSSVCMVLEPSGRSPAVGLMGSA